MPGLFDPLTLRGITIRNRIAVSPMVQMSSADGFASDWHLVHLGSRAVGGAGLVLTEATAVEPTGRISLNDLGLWNDDHIGGLRRIADFIRAEGAVPGIQLAHAGRKSSYAPPFDQKGIRPLRSLAVEEGAWPVYGASEIPYGADAPHPRAMTVDDIERVVEAFAAAARRADAAGFDVIEIHGAHGYLPHCFCSPLSNSRNDQYGGAFENRVRFFLEVARAVRAVLPPAKVLAARVSYTDWAEGGWTLDETVLLVGFLTEIGVDLIDVSSGGTTPTVMMKQLLDPDRSRGEPTSTGGAVIAEIPIGPGYQVPGAATIRTTTQVAVAAVGLITEPEQADEIIASGKADMVMLGRALLRDPYWPQRAAVALGRTRQLRLPVQYHLAWRGIADFSYLPVFTPGRRDL
jgi:2,4-dienoyl-CoA reductase-like NADH-dependent reductase (Old Yellow Enzyme family)